MRDKKVKIVATLGPASETEEKIKKLAEIGVDVFRLNLSHGSSEWVEDVVKRIRDVEEKLDRPLTIMGDLAGPKIRIGNVIDGITLLNDQTVEFVPEQLMGNQHVLSINYPSILGQLEKGAEIYIDDGRIKLEVNGRTRNGVKTKVIVGGSLKPYKGFYAQGISLHLRGLSKKDTEDVKHMVGLGVDSLAISFVQSEKDLLFVRNLLPQKSPVMLVAKIETALALKNIDEIIKVSDGLMVARGDLGLAVPIQEVPHLQKELIAKCLKSAKPVITATQMLESMHHNPLPTRAEVTDVANAILDGTDAVMLSGETAMGEFPVETVRMMVQIIKGATPYVEERDYYDEHFIGNAVSSSVGKIADQIEAKLIIALTEKGITARRISRHRHPQAIIALSPDIASIRKMNFSWGVVPYLIERTKSFEHMREQAMQFAKKNDVVSLEKDDPFVIVAGMPFGQSGTTNMIFIERV